MMSSARALCLLALAAFAMAESTTEVATEQFPCVCQGGIPTKLDDYKVAKIITFDGMTLKMTNDQKTVGARSLNSKDIPKACKFEFTIESDERVKHKKIRVDWAGVSFGIHPKNDKKYRRTMQFGRASDVYKRGMGVSGTSKVRVPSTYSKKGTQVALEILYQNDTNTAYRMTSETCNYQLDYVQDDASRWDSFVLSLGPEYAGHVEGFCGTCDGKKGNDRKTWDGVKVQNMKDGGFRTLLESYKYGNDKLLAKAKAN